MNRLVVNGCSYSQIYAQGQGHVALANQLGIHTTSSLALSGSCNTRILRTLLKDSFQTETPTFYIVGLAFLGRSELPVSVPNSEFEGRWMSITNFPSKNALYEVGWNSDLTQQHINLRHKYQTLSIEDRLEDLMYYLISIINDIKSRGHGILVFKQASDVYEWALDQPRFDLLKKTVNIVNGLSWSANEWQYNHGVQWQQQDAELPQNIRHPMLGQYHVLNEFLLDYIHTHKLV